MDILLFDLNESVKYSHRIHHYNPKEIIEFVMDEEFLLGDEEDSAKVY